MSLLGYGLLPKALTAPLFSDIKTRSIPRMILPNQNIFQSLHAYKFNIIFLSPAPVSPAPTDYIFAQTCQLCAFNIVVLNMNLRIRLVENLFLDLDNRPMPTDRVTPQDSLSFANSFVHLYHPNPQWTTAYERSKTYKSEDLLTCTYSLT